MTYKYKFKLIEITYAKVKDKQIYNRKKRYIKIYEQTLLDKKVEKYMNRQNIHIKKDRKVDKQIYTQIERQVDGERVIVLCFPFVRNFSGILKPLNYVLFRGGKEEKGKTMKQENNKCGLVYFFLLFS